MTSESVAELIALLGPIAGPIFVIWWVMRGSSSGTREDPIASLLKKMDDLSRDVEAVDTKHDDLSTRIARIEGKLEGK